MRIVITAHGSRVGGGVSVAKNLILALTKAGSKNEYLCTIPAGLGFEATVSSGTVRFIPFEHRSLLQRLAWEERRLPKMVRSFQPDAVLNMANRAFVNPPAPQATLVHDSHLFYPFSQFGRISLQARLQFHFHRIHFRRTLKSISALFCQTEVARRRIIETYRPPCEVLIIPNQLSPDTVASQKSVARPIIPKQYLGMFKLLVLSRYYSHKNLEIIPRLLASYPGKLRDVLFVLTIPESQDPWAARYLADLRKIDKYGNVVNIGHVPSNELAGLYAQTDALFMPTLLESFSGTYLEAMNYGRPIVTSDLDFARDVCGDAALYINPAELDSVLRGIIRLKEEAGLRRDLVERGRIRKLAHAVTWEDNARAILRTLEAIARPRNETF